MMGIVWYSTLQQYDTNCMSSNAVRWLCYCSDRRNPRVTGVSVIDESKQWNQSETLMKSDYGSQWLIMRVRAWAISRF